MYQIRTDLALETQEKMQALKKVLRENQSLLLDRHISRLFYSPQAASAQSILSSLEKLGLDIQGRHYFVLGIEHAAHPVAHRCVPSHLSGTECTRNF